MGGTKYHLRIICVFFFLGRKGDKINLRHSLCVGEQTIVSTDTLVQLYGQCVLLLLEGKVCLYKLALYCIIAIFIAFADRHLSTKMAPSKFIIYHSCSRWDTSILKI